MTKEAYLDMCEQLNSEPIESEIPVGFEDMPDEVLDAYHVYNVLPEKIDSFNGNYYGRSIELAPALIKFMDLSPAREIFKVVMIINYLEKEAINKNRKK